MIPNLNAREIESKGITATNSFGISLDDSAHIMTILRDTLYSDKVLAILREYSSNAWDAHREAGKKDVPIKVTLPTKADPTLYIQDFGNGLSHDDMFRVYTQYGASTKRKSDDMVGMLGIGSKSGFAYSDSFTIVSSHGGKRRTYVAVLDESEKGTINLLNEEDYDEDTGVTIRIPAKPEDTYEFVTKATNLFRHFNPRPEINIKLPDPPMDRLLLKNGVLSGTRDNDTSQGWVAVMGCVPYRINLDQITGPHNPEGGIGEHVRRLAGVLFFDIGEVKVSASREELKYDVGTKKALILKFNAIVDEYVHTTIDALENDTQLTVWEKRVRAQILNHLHLPVPKEFKALLATRVELKGIELKSFLLTSKDGTTPSVNIDIDPETRLILRDDYRSLSGFHELRRDDYIVKLLDGFSWDDVNKELDKVLKKVELFGIPVVKLSSFNWVAPATKKASFREKNDKHKVASFRYQPTGNSYPWSNKWEIEKRVPTKDDVFVLIRGFQTEAFGHNFYSEYRKDRDLAAPFKVEMPPVYGYKSTEKRPRSVEKCVGTHYPEWRKQFIQSLLTKENKRLLEIYETAEILEGIAKHGGHVRRNSYATLIDLLGFKHPITQLLKHQRNAMKSYKKIPTDIRSSLQELYDRAKETLTFKSMAILKQIEERYPLLSVQEEGIAELWGQYGQQWGDYVTLIDKYKPDLIPIQKKEDDDIFDDIF